jgi:hypothetical protein
MTSILNIKKAILEILNSEANSKSLSGFLLVYWIEPRA